jgi:hypothetical protein
MYQAEVECLREADYGAAALARGSMILCATRREAARLQCAKRGIEIQQDERWRCLETEVGQEIEDSLFCVFMPSCSGCGSFRGREVEARKEERSNPGNDAII